MTLQGTPGYDSRPCRGLDPALFHPERGANAAVIAAKAVCATCPIAVRYACLLHALDHNEEHGIWGGTSASEREKMRRKRLHRRRVVA